MNIKFRFWEKPSKKFIYDIDALSKNPSVLISKIFSGEDSQIVAEQFTGLTDKNGVEIYEGDIVVIPSIEIEYQTHTGDNIPNGSYTEPIGCTLNYNQGIIVLQDAMFQIDFDGHFQPLFWSIENIWDKETALNTLDLTRNQDLFNPDYSQALEDLDYILEESIYNSLEEMFEDLSGVKIIGNIHENPELI